MAGFERHIVWKKTPADLVQKMHAALENLDDVLFYRLQLLAGDAEQYMKDNAPWTDRTGAARRGLEVKIERVAGRGKITVKGGDEVFYQVFLEFANSGRFAIIRPTMERFMFEAMRRLEGAMKGR